jgi:phosphotransferase system enzyme I (PtsI)
MDLVKTKITEDTYLVGIAVSPGIGIGEVCLVDQRPLVDESTIEPQEVEAELERFRAAVEKAREQLRKIKQTVSRQQHLREHLYILDTHMLILEDEMLIDKTEQAIREQLNAEGALTRVVGQLRTLFENIEDEYLRERHSDVDAVGERLLRILSGVNERSLVKSAGKSIVVAHDLSPAETMQMDREQILGFLTDKGGRTSHTAILARTLNIPAVVGLESITSLVSDRLPVIVDGSTGVVILRPSEETFKEYLKRKQQFEYLEHELESYRDFPAVTLDQIHVALRANLEMAQDYKLAHKHAAEGVGLFRTEFLFLGRKEPPSEEEQLAAYCEILNAMKGQPVTIRTLDIGGDKFVAGLNLDEEPNPAMGLRAIRFSLHEEHLFKTQLRAIARASGYGPVRILFPMICGVAEIRACKYLLREVEQELAAQGLAYDPDMPIGIMIETPSAVLIADLLATEVDFFSIGTNDLIQYMLAVDRGNEHVAYLYEPLHPSVLRALKLVCDAANAADIKVGICGEMAGEPLYAMALVGLGLHELSMNPACVPRVKRVLRHITQKDGKRLSETLLSLSTSEEVSSLIDQEMRARLPEIFARPII